MDGVEVVHEGFSDEVLTMANLCDGCGTEMAVGSSGRLHRRTGQLYCADCHADGARKGGVAFDSFSSEAALKADRELWLKALKNLRAGIMPPAKKPCPLRTEPRVRRAPWNGRVTSKTSQPME